MKKKDLSGLQFGRLIVLKRDGTRNGNSYWACQCSCGNMITVSAPHLKTGHTQSCGCLKKEATANRSVKHGNSNTRVYRIWAGMLQRCSNPRRKEYPVYGGRGIRVCDEWQEFSAFHQWAIENGYGDTLSIDRINADGNYSPDNCRWVSIKEQQNNRRNNLPPLTIRGEQRTITEWSMITGLSYGAIHGRLYSLGYSAEKALQNKG